MSGELHRRIEAQLSAPVSPPVAAFAQRLAEGSGADAALFYGSNLRTGELEGVLDFYLLMPGDQKEKIWPRVSYHEWKYEGRVLRAKVARISLGTFAKAASGQSRDTTIWARFVQPSACVWQRSDLARAEIIAAVTSAIETASRLAAALGPASGEESEFWKALFQATYKAEFRIEKPGREDSILSLNKRHFDGLLPLGWASAGIGFSTNGAFLTPHMTANEKQETIRWWNSRRRFGKPLNIVRLLKASATFEGAGRYAAWKVERHTGVPVEVTPWREKHPILAAPGVLLKVWRSRRNS